MVQTLEAGSHVKRKRKRKRKRKSKRRLHVERKRRQNEIRTCISVSPDGGNIVSRVRITLDYKTLNKDSEKEIKDGGRGRHLGLNVNRRGIERVLFILRFPWRFPSSHV